ncbi:MAG TPA: metallophosphoesterase [Thermomicrobiales bacterium]|nr:metallophosphoesterase [Thermomicrobiales bacterium]
MLSTLLTLLAPGVTAQGEASPVASPAAEGATPAAGATPSASGGQHAWVELGPGGAVIARAISPAGCPEIEIDEVAYQMDVRAEPSDDHPVTVCESDIPPGTASVKVGDAHLPLPSPDPQRILVIGDTGCRLKDGEEVQACDDPSAWPFATVAQQGAAWQPDLIIHVGDYLYREAPCPEGDAGCAGSPYGDTWATWEADFFAPAAPLLDAAPWIVMRGNHEDCTRNGEGWFRYLDPLPMPVTCQDYTDPYLLEIGDVRAIVMDSATAGDVSSDDDMNEAFREQFAEVERLAEDGPAWLLTHRPFWSIAATDDGQTEWTTSTYTGAGYEQPPTEIDMVVSGHVHLAEVLEFTEASGRPVQVIAGNSGTNLESMDSGVFTGSEVGDETLIQGLRYREFGFVGLELVDTGWVITMPMVDGSTPVSCLVVGRDAACVP